jgi:hypothetical protein
MRTTKATAWGVVTANLLKKAWDHTHMGTFLSTHATVTKEEGGYLLREPGLSLWSNTILHLFCCPSRALQIPIYGSLEASHPMDKWQPLNETALALK